MLKWGWGVNDACEHVKMWCVGVVKRMIVYMKSVYVCRDEMYN